MKLKKTRKAMRMRGKGMGTHGWGARKKHMGSGHRGGCGMAGSGKRANHRKSFVIKEYDNKYFGKQGITSKSTRRKKNDVVNIREIIMNMDKFKSKFSDKEGFINLEDYKILGEGEIKQKINIKTKSISQGAKEKIEKAGGTVIIIKPKKEE